jgi:hypothetical protein
MSTKADKLCFWGVERGRCVGLTTSPPSVILLSRQCWSLDVSWRYRPPRPVTGISSLILLKMETVYSSVTWVNSQKYNPSHFMALIANPKQSGAASWRLQWLEPIKMCCPFITLHWSIAHTRTQSASTLRHYATSQKVAGSRPHEVKYFQFT